MRYLVILLAVDHSYFHFVNIIYNDVASVFEPGCSDGQCVCDNVIACAATEVVFGKFTFRGLLHIGLQILSFAYSMSLFKRLQLNYFNMLTSNLKTRRQLQHVQLLDYFDYVHQLPCLFFQSLFFWLGFF